MMMRPRHFFETIAALAVLLSAASCGQPQADVRTMQYFPDGREIVCLNGNNRYTRALYGTHTNFRMETSVRVYSSGRCW